jgi:hypothetical protein
MRPQEWGRGKHECLRHIAKDTYPEEGMSKFESETESGPPVPEDLLPRWTFGQRGATAPNLLQMMWALRPA